MPNYAVFDEKRYFQPGKDATVVELDGLRLGLIICEDVWEPEPSRAAAAAGAEAILIINGSPFHMHQQRVREEVLAARARETPLPMVYLNMVGGQDELVFDGGSLVVDRHGAVAFRAPLFEEDLHVVELVRKNGIVVSVPGAVAPTPPLVERVYGALVLGTRDYVDKNGFPGIILGLSGGVDSALTLAIAVDALGADRAQAVMMPSRFTSKMSLEDAAEQAKRLGVRYEVLSIEPIFQTTLEVLRGRVRRFAARCDRGEHPGALPRHPADGDLEQARQDAADDWQQERDGGRLRDAVRRHGGRICAAQGLHQDARLPAC